MLGEVVTWNADRGYGFIRPDADEEWTDADLFAHIAEVLPGSPISKMAVGVKVSCTAGTAERGPKAAQIRILSVPADAADLQEREQLAARLREARLFLGLTQQDVAGALELPRPAISEIETGGRKVSGLELRRFARLYRRPVAWLLGEDAPVDEELLAATAALVETDRATVLRFAQFLAASGQAPAPERVSGT